MKYYRIHTSDNAYITKQPRGIFTAVGKLVDNGILSDAEVKEYWKNREYFEKVLPVPPYYENNNPDGAITWFKDSDKSDEIWNQMVFYREMCKKYGVKLFISECNEIPGELIYEDDFQIAVKNHENDGILTQELVYAMCDKGMIEYRIASEDDIDQLIDIRLKMLRDVNSLEKDYRFSDKFIEATSEYFAGGKHTTVIAKSARSVIGCASICYLGVMPTFSHPGGKRAHLMNVYTSDEYRRMGIAERMILMLIDDAWKNGASEISLDTTKAGRKLYEKIGFVKSDECMVLVRQTTENI